MSVREGVAMRRTGLWVAVVLAAGCHKAEDRVVVYCAQDQEFAEGVFADFTTETNLAPEADRPRSLLDLTNPKWKGKVAIAKPQFGTTATQAACLFEVLGPDAARAFYRGLKANDVRVVPGNKQAAEGTTSGDFAIG